MNPDDVVDTFTYGGRKFNLHRNGRLTNQDGVEMVKQGIGRISVNEDGSFQSVTEIRLTKEEISALIAEDLAAKEVLDQQDAAKEQRRIRWLLIAYCTVVAASMLYSWFK